MPPPVEWSTLRKARSLGNTAYVVPSPISVRSSSSTGREPVSPISESRSPLSELDGSGTVHLMRRNATIVSEIDGSPVEAAPPSYSEIAGTETGGRTGQAKLRRDKAVSRSKKVST